MEVYMNSKKVILMGFISSAILLNFIESQFMKNNAEAGFLKVLIYTLTLTCAICYLTFVLAINISSLVKMGYCKYKGYQVFPLVLYPFCFIKVNGKIKVRWTNNYVSPFRDLYPYDFYERYKDSYDDKAATEFGVMFLKIRAYARLIVPGILFVIYLVNGRYDRVFWVITFAAFLFALGFIKEEKYHGEFIQCKNMRKGDTILYLAKELPIYAEEYSDIYRRFEKRLQEGHLEEYRNYINATLFHMYVCKCINPDFEISETTDTYMKENVLKKDKIRFGMFENSWELVKAYVFCNRINNNQQNLEYVISELRFLKQDFGSVFNKFYGLIEWYIQIASGEYRYQSDFNYHKYLYVSDRFYDLAPEHEKNLKRIEENIIDGGIRKKIRRDCIK